MDGFNVIPVEKDSTKNSALNIPADFSVEIIDEEKEKTIKEKKVKKSNLLLFVSILFLFSVLGYFVFLVFYRIMLVGQIINLTEQMKGVTQNIDKQEIQEYQTMDNTLKSVKGKLSKHVLTSEIISFLNQNLRKTLQITEYRLDVKETEVEVGIAAVAPSFKELAEQTEKFFLLKNQGAIQSFTVSSLSFETETKRVKFSMRIILDKTKVNAVTLSQNTNNI